MYCIVVLQTEAKMNMANTSEGPRKIFDIDQESSMGVEQLEKLKEDLKSPPSEAELQIRTFKGSVIDNDLVVNDFLRVAVPGIGGAEGEILEAIYTGWVPEEGQITPYHVKFVKVRLLRQKDSLVQIPWDIDFEIHPDRIMSYDSERRIMTP